MRIPEKGVGSRQGAVGRGQSAVGQSAVGQSAGIVSTCQALCPLRSAQISTMLLRMANFTKSTKVRTLSLRMMLVLCDSTVRMEIKS